jgi:hypothetical protein
MGGVGAIIRSRIESDLPPQRPDPSPLPQSLLEGRGFVVIRDAAVDVFYYNQPVESADQAVSLVHYLDRHGWQAWAEGIDQVVIPLECPTRDDAAEKSAAVHTLIGTWRLFWEHSDKGVFDLPVYTKE